MSVACVLVPHYKCALARLADPALRERPLIVADRLERGHAIDLDEAAFALGARSGMTLVQAGACAREAAIAVDDPARNAELWERVLDALDAASPLVESAAEGVAYLEMRGITPRSASANPKRTRRDDHRLIETRLIASIHAALAALDERDRLDIRVALAPNRFVARVAASAGDGTIVRDGEERAFVANVPLETLGIDTATIERLHLLGLTNLGAIAALPHGPFVRRFGPPAARWHDAARGVDPAPVVPRPRRLTIDATLYGEGSAEREDQLLFALRTLVARVADDVAAAGKRCGFLRLVLECEDGETLELPTLLAQPTAQPRAMFDLLRARLESVTVEGAPLRSPVTGLRLGAERLEDGGAPLSLFATSDPDPEAVAIAVARLEAAFGAGAALRARMTDGFRYESRFVYDTFDPTSVTRSVAQALRAQTAPFEPHAESPRSDIAARDDTIATLTYRIVPLRALDVRTARGVPVSVDGSDVVDCAGPWRSDESWWSPLLVSTEEANRAALVRDVYDVALDDGRLLRIACESPASLVPQAPGETSAHWLLCGNYD